MGAHLVFAGDEPPLDLVAVLVEEPGGPVAGHAAVDGVVHPQDVAAAEGELLALARSLTLRRRALEHGADVVRVPGRVLHLARGVNEILRKF